MSAGRRMLRLFADDPRFAALQLAACALVGLGRLAGIPAIFAGPLLALLLAALFAATLRADRRQARSARPDTCA